jgi:hypothetical protein
MSDRGYRDEEPSSGLSPLARLRRVVMMPDSGERAFRSAPFERLPEADGTAP